MLRLALIEAIAGWLRILAAVIENELTEENQLEIIAAYIRRHPLKRKAGMASKKPDNNR